MKSKSRSTTNKLILLLAFVLVLAAGAVPPAQAQTFSVLYNFSGASNGANPLNGLMIDASGNLYGTASAGGTSNNGVVFEINTSGVEWVLHSFSGGTDGENPEGVLVADKAGNLYGTTMGGGVSGAGTVFVVTAAGKEKVLYSFTGASDGVAPEAGLVWHAANLYGTTTAGGAYGNGTVFKLSPPTQKGGEWTEEVLYSFGIGSDGTIPVGGVTFDAVGNLYGTTSAGGAFGYGTVFQLTPSESGWTENILHDFQNGDDGAVPYAGLITDSAGNFYGAATEGGTGGGGTVFELTPANNVWTFTVLYSIPGWGISGAFRHLIMDSSGNLYGTTHCDGAYDAGTVYKLTPAVGSWTYTSFYVFTGGSDGLYSYSSLVFKDGSFYGTTADGGENGLGVIFKIVP